MSTALLSGELAPVTTVAKQRTGKRPVPATVWRWLRKGVCSGTVRLQAVCHGGKWLTTVAAFDQFLNEQTAYALRQDEPSGSAMDNCDEALIAAGLL